ncbi:MAG: ComF family protein [Rickettsiales bacterium]
MLNNALARVVDFLFPPSCPLCRLPTASARALCGACWGKLEHIGAPNCEKCGDPFEYFVPGPQLCVKCMTVPRRLDAAIAALSYNDAAKKLVYRLKFCDAVDLVPMMATQMAAAGRDAIARSDVIIPVPSCRKRLRRRKYNQSALLARRIARQSGKPVTYRALLKIKSTPPQTSLSAKARERNLSAAFLAPSRNAEEIAGKNILLIDDVYTTGATVEACAKALKKAGAAQVRALTLCKTLKKM